MWYRITALGPWTALVCVVSCSIMGLSAIPRPPFLLCPPHFYFGRRLRSTRAKTQIMSIPSFVWRSHTNHDGSTAVINTAPSAPPMSPGSSGSACSTVYGSSAAKAQMTLQPPVGGSSAPSQPQQATQLSPPRTPPKPTALTSHSAAVATVPAEAGSPETRGPGFPPLLSSSSCAPTNPAVREQPQHYQMPLLSPPRPLQSTFLIPTPAAVAAHALARQQDSASGGLKSASEPSSTTTAAQIDRLPGIVELSPWKEGVREAGTKGRGGKVPTRGDHRKHEKREGPTVSAWEQSLVKQAVRGKGSDRQWSRGRLPAPTAPVAVDSGSSAGASNKKSVECGKGKQRDKRTPGGEEASGDRAAGEDKASAQLETAEPSPAPADSAAGSAPRMPYHSLDSSEDDSLTASSWAWQREGRQGKDGRPRSPSSGGSVDLDDLTREELIVRVEQVGFGREWHVGAEAVSVCVLVRLFSATIWFLGSRWCGCLVSRRLSPFNRVRRLGRVLHANLSRLPAWRNTYLQARMQIVFITVWLYAQN